MPGINAIFSHDPLSRPLLGSSLAEFDYREGLTLNDFFTPDNVSITFHGYKGYPSQSFEDKDMVVLIEGLIYNRTDFEIHSALQKIAEAYLAGKDHKKLIIDFIDRSDGDFLALLYFKNQSRAIIFNDRWGRLPTFFVADRNLFALSRETKFLLHWLESIEFDPPALAEFLAFEYTLGEKTIFKKIRRLSPASSFEIDFSGAEVVVQTEMLRPVCFDAADSGLSRKEILNHTVSLFQESLLTRVRRFEEKGIRIIADLSGGFDTRALFLGLCRSGADFTPCHDRLATGDESAVAQALADSFGKKLHKSAAVYPVDNFAEMKRIIYLTDCQVNGWTSLTCFYDDLEREKTLSGLMVHFMGFGGEFIRHPYRLQKPYRDLAAALNDDASTNFINISDASGLTNLARKNFQLNLQQEIARFPEKNDSGRIRHLYFDYYNRVVNGGENRHRLFSWTVQPLWGKNLFEFEMNHIALEMIDFGFFIDFLSILEPRALDIPIYGLRNNLKSKTGRRLFNARMNLKNHLRDNRYIFKAYKSVRSRLYRYRNKGPLYQPLVAELRQTHNRSLLVSRYFDKTALERFLAGNPAMMQLYQLLTLMLYMAEIESRYPAKIR